LIFHCKIVHTIDVAFKALQSKATDLSNTLKRLKICLKELEGYRQEIENLKKEANSIAEK